MDLFKIALRFTTEKMKIVFLQDAEGSLEKNLLLIDRLFFVIFVKNKNYSIDHINFSIYTVASMANTKSAIKRIRRISRQTDVNKSRKSRFRSAIKKMNLILDKKDKKEALAFLPKLNSELMKISKSGIIKKQNASRNISRITKKINAL
tara:strand:- start:631 stop:1077 length:447 start_codon:yes stop_codon:yes gene_type:complete